MAKGLFLVGRETFGHPVVGLKKPLWFAAWVWMLGEARWKQSMPIDIYGMTITLKRGQLSCSYRFMSDITGLTVKGVRVFLARLEEEGMITIGKTPVLPGKKKGTLKGIGQTIITICNYDTYQDFEEYRAQVEAEEGHGRGTVGAQTITPEVTPEVTPDDKPKKPRRKASRISDNWTPDKTDIKHVTTKGYSHDQINTLADRFRDHWIAASGKGSTALDWNAKWRTWIANDIEWNGLPASREINGKKVPTRSEIDDFFGSDLRSVSDVDGSDTSASGPIIEHDPAGYKNH